MAWVRIDDGFPDHPKVVQAGPLAMAMQVAALCYANRHLTDGFLPVRAVASFLPTVAFDPETGQPITWRDVAQALVDAGIWVEVEGGYQIHDYHDYQPSREEVMAERAIARRRWAMNNNPELRRIVRSRDGDNCRYCGITVNWRDRKSPQGGTYDHVIPINRGGDESPENIVVCCRQCNLKKGARTPEEAGMELLPPGAKRESTRNQDGIKTESSTESRHPIPIPTPKNNNSSPSEKAANESPHARRGRKLSESPNPTDRVLAYFGQKFESKFGAKPHLSFGKDGALAKKLVNQYGEDRVRDLIDRFFELDDDWVQTEGGYTVGVFVSQINKLLSVRPKARAEPDFDAERARIIAELKAQEEAAATGTEGRTGWP